MAKTELTIEDKLKALYKLQLIDSELDKIKILRGELPMEVKDLEDEIVGMTKRIERLESGVNEIDQQIAGYRGAIKDAEALMVKYKKQMDEVRNDREYKALTKELEDQDLDVKLALKRIRDAEKKKETRVEVLDGVKKKLEDMQNALTVKQSELAKIIEKTEKEEAKLIKASDKAKKSIEERLLKSYTRIRGNYRNGLAVVAVERDACGGCFNKVPAQIQLELSLSKKIIACEHCGRILVDPEILEAPKSAKA
ncbi:MAG TPA: hypothetical protein ENK85_01690 [Saprospiraceae bacterium]|nr:hypothetical protein [Saprospiraceae bacterium]